MYLVPCRLELSQPVPQSLLTKYDLQAYVQLSRSLFLGDVRGYLNALQVRGVFDSFFSDYIRRIVVATPLRSPYRRALLATAVVAFYSRIRIFSFNLECTYYWSG